ncbi:MAG: Spy/CpxP family protein refolding chaperone [Rhodopila sp.]|jgi:acyl-CoA reductase-like NAD-dependent aldehyde dehydrogenase
MKTFAMVGIMLMAAAPALAQTASPAVNGPEPNTPAARAANPATAEEQVNQRIAQMHQRLKITAEQQPAWDAFAQVMRDNMTSIATAYKERSASVATMSAPDNMRNFEQARADDIQKLAASFQTLYDGMSDDQKKIADAMFRNYDESGPRRRNAPK